MSFDRATLRTLAGMSDEIGVLSLYVTRDPHLRAEATGSTPWELRLRQQLTALRERLKQDGPRSHWKALTERLEQLRPDIDRLVDPTSSGQGAALFAGVASGEVIDVAVQVPLVDRVVLEPTAYLRPLVTAWSVAGPAGAVSVSPDELKLVDTRFGEAAPVGAIAVLFEAEEQRMLRGPASTVPGMPHHGNSQQDLYERREGDKLVRFLRTVGPQVAEHVERRDWDYLAITGDPVLVNAVREGLPPRLPAEVICLDHPVNSLGPAKLAATVAPAVDEARSRRHRALAEQARDHALAANTGAYGLGETLGALQEGRVAHLLLAADRSWTGGSTPDGFLVPDREIPPGVDPDDVRPEPHLAERMIELAFREGGEVTVLTEQEAAPLAEADGVAALLRW